MIRTASTLTLIQAKVAVLILENPQDDVKLEPAAPNWSDSELWLLADTSGCGEIGTNVKCSR